MSLAAAARLHQQIRERDAGLCARCGRPCPPGAGSVHHRRPRGMGGSRDPLTNDPSNLVLLCGSGTTGCHGYLEAFRSESLETGWLLRQGADPRTSPVLVGGRWMQPGETWTATEPKEGA